MVRFRTAFLAPAVLFLLCVVLYWKLLAAPSTYVWFDHYDLCELEIPRLQFFARSLHSGHLPLWNPHIWMGQPVLGSGQPGLLSPLNLIFTALVPLNHGELSFAALNSLFVLLHFLGGWFCYLFCRGVSLAATPSIIGGLAFAATGFFGTTPHLDLASAAALTPLIFLFAFRLWTGGAMLGNAASLGLVLGLAWLTGHHEIPLISCYTILLGSLGIVLYRWRRIEWRILAGTGIALCLAVAISAVQTLPMMEFGRLSKRWVGMQHPIGWGQRVSYQVHAQYSMPWRGLGEFVVAGTPGTAVWSNYVGVTIVALAILALVYRRRDPAVRILGLLGFFSLLYALGVNTPFHRALYELLPMLDKARSPDRGVYLAGFALSALAACGSSVLMEAKSAPSLIRRSAGYVLIALVTLEATTAASYRMAYVGQGRGACAWALRDYRALGERLRNAAPSRVAADQNQLMTDIGGLYGVDALEAFVAAVPSNILRLEVQTPRTQYLLGVTHRVGIRESRADETTIGEYGRGVRLFKVDNAMPRAWIVHQVEIVNSDNELRRAIFDPATNLAGTAVMLDRGVELAQCSGSDAVTVSRPNSDSLVVVGSLGCRGLLVVSDALYPGWRAYVDGHAQPVVEVFGALRGVVVEGGRHTAEMRYEPRSVYFGALISVLGLVVGLVLRRSGKLLRVHGC